MSAFFSDFLSLEKSIVHLFNMINLLVLIYMNKYTANQTENKGE
nr:MAG TPA: hypothetical protein [Caudoviricetes sp.]